MPKNGVKTAKADTAEPTITWSGVNNYQKRVSSDSYWTISEMSTSINSTYGTCGFDANNRKASGQANDYTTGYSVPQFVLFKATVSLPAYTKWDISFTGYLYHSETTTASGYGWSDFYVINYNSDTSNQLHFGYVSGTGTENGYSGTYKQRKHIQAKGSTANSTNVSHTATFANNSNSSSTNTVFFGLFMNDSKGGSGSKYKYSSYVQMDNPTCTLVENLGPKKPSVEDSQKVKNFDGNFKDFTVNDIGNSTLTEVKHKVNGTDTVLYAYDPDTVTTTGNSHMTNNVFKVKDAGVYTLKFKRESAAVVWDGGDTEEYCEVQVEIKPKPVSISWASQQYDNGATGADSLFFMLPSPNVTVQTQQLLSDVKYYKHDDYDVGTGNIVAGASDVSLEDLQQDTDYYAVVNFNPDTAGNNYTFDGNNFYAFSTSDDRQIVVVTITNSGEKYNGSAHPATASAVTTTGETLVVGTDIDFSYTYYLEDDPVYGGESGSDVAPTHAGSYTLKVGIKPTYNEDYKPYDNMTFTYVIEKADPVLDPIPANSSAQLYTGDSLPEIVKGTSGTAGTYVWNAGQTLLSGKHEYSYKFTPTDTVNYNTANGKLELVAYDAKISSISATFNPDGVDIYDSWSLDDLIPYLAVVGTDESGATVDPLYGYTLSGTLTAGTSTITVKYGSGADEVTCTFTVNDVIACVLESISATLSNADKIYTSTDLEDLKNWLEVRGTYNDGRDHGVIASSDYDLAVDSEDGELFVGVADIVVSYWDEDGVEHKTTFPVNVKPVILESISAEFNPGLNEIKCTMPLNDLKNWLTVKGTNSDGSDYGEIAADDYTLTGKLKNNSVSTVTVKYNGKSTTFDVDVINLPNGGVRTLIPIPELKEAAYTGKEIDIISGWEHSGLVDSVGAKATIAGTYKIVLTIKDYDLYEWDTSVLPAEAEPAAAYLRGVKSLAKYAVAGDFVGYSVEDDTLTAEWTIAPAVLRGTWNDKGTLDLLSGSYKGSFDNTIGYKYTDKDGNEVTSLLEGETYTVSAELLDTKNFVLDSDTATLLSQSHEYTVPKTIPKVSAMSVFASNIKNFMTKSLMGLPVWLWILIALAALILLIILIAVIAKRRKTKEEREEKKRLKEEERAEEKRRREEEREAEKRRREQELELQKAKQEAELAKMRASLGLGAGAAGMAMAAQQQQPMQMQPQMPMQQQMPQYQQPMMQQPQYPQYMPQQMQSYGPQQQYGGGDPFARIEAELANLRTEHRAEKEAAHNAAQEITAAKFEAAQQVAAAQMREEFAKLRAGGMQPVNGILPMAQPEAGVQKNLSSEILGDAIISAVRKLLVQPQAEPQTEYVQKTEESAATAVNTPTVYPPDAVITTTTTVDTTKPKSATPRSDDGRVFDLDGFYDAFENNK